MGFWKKKKEDAEDLEIMDMLEQIQKEKEEKEEKEAEELRKAEELKKAEEERVAEEARRIEEEKIVEEKRIAEELRRAEEERLAKEQEEKDVLEAKEKDLIDIIEIPDEFMENVKVFLETHNTKYVVGWKICDGDVLAYFYSNNKEIRATEFLNFIVGEYDNAQGDAEYAKATIPKLLFRVLLSDVNETTVKKYLEKKIQEYYNECDWIRTDGMVNQTFLKQMGKCKKKRIPWAFVRTVDILPNGEKFRIRMLENESEIELTASDNVYIMIGIKGEIYNITEEKFIMTYLETKEEFDICEIMPVYMPVIYACKSGKKVSIDDKAHLCYPKSSKMVYAKELERRTKVFSLYNKGEYFVGNQGDYLIVREDDINDVYIIQRDIFEETYEKIEEVDENLIDA